MDDVFATRLKALRLSHRLKLKDIGEAVGYDMTTIGNLENAKTAPSLTMIMSLAKFFDVSLDYLLGRQEKEMNPSVNRNNPNENIVPMKISNKVETEPRIGSKIELDIFAPRLKDLRLARRMTQRNVGEAVGFDMKTIGNLEKAHRPPSLGLILALADFFDVSVDYLVGWSNYKAGTDDGNDETTNPSSSPSAERKKLIGLIDGLREEEIDKVLSYISFIRYDRRREDKKLQCSRERTETTTNENSRIKNFGNLPE